VDPKGRGLSPLSSLPHLGWPLAQEAQQAIHLLRQVVEEMGRRDRAARSDPHISVRLVGRVMSGQDALLAAGVGGTGAEQLPGGGAFIMVAEGRVTKLQAAYSSPQDLERLAPDALLSGDADTEGVSRLKRVARGLRLVR